jgi:hypothetical protein
MRRCITARETFLISENCLEMDFDYLKIVLNDFTLKQMFIINWFNNNLDKNIQDRHSKILHLLRRCCDEDLKEWTTLKLEQALMAINELGFLSRNEEKELNASLCSYLTVGKYANTIAEPYVQKCCSIKLDMNIGRNITVFSINNSYSGAVMNGYCQICKRKYSHNYFINDKKKFVTYESMFNSHLIYLGGEYAYEKSLIKWLSNSILYLHSGFENFSKCYNETRKTTCDNLDHNEGDMSPTRIQDFWFLYNFVTFSFFYTNKKILKIPLGW